MDTKETEFIYSERSNKKQRFDKRLIAHIIGLAQQGVPGRDLIREYGMASCTLRDWMRRDSTSVPVRKSYTTTEKRSVVRAVETGMGVKQAQIAFNVSSRSLVQRWIKEFKEENAELSANKTIEVAKKTADTSEDLELNALKKALEEANMKIRALDTMIDIAEQQLKIDIRKKSGAKQSSK